MPMGGTLIQAQPRPIPWLAVQVWCDRVGYGSEAREFVPQAVALLDRAFLAYCVRVQQKAGPAQDDKLARWDAA